MGNVLTVMKAHGFDTHSSVDNPDFVDIDGADNIEGTADDDFTLQSDSPARGTGKNISTPE